MKFAKLTGIRTDANEAPEVKALTMKGQIKLNTAAAKLLGVAKGDFIIMNEDVDKESDTYGKIFICKADAGSKLGNQNDSGAGSLTFADGNSWSTLKKGNDVNRIQVFNPTPVTVEIEEGVTETFYMLDYVREEDKLERAAKGEGKASSEDENEGMTKKSRRGRKDGE